MARLASTQIQGSRAQAAICNVLEAEVLVIEDDLATRLGTRLESQKFAKALYRLGLKTVTTEAFRLIEQY